MGNAAAAAAPPNSNVVDVQCNPQNRTVRITFNSRLWYSFDPVLATPIVHAELNDGPSTTVKFKFPGYEIGGFVRPLSHAQADEFALNMWAAVRKCQNMHVAR